MNFNEKLIKLRKENGLSQEELGYKLNVTRQTVSKWELGQTTPEMDKLVEISKIFGVTLDDLTSNTEITNNETERIEDEPINEKRHNNSTLKIILLIVAIVVIVGLIFYAVVFSKVFNFGKGIFDKATKMNNEITNKVLNVMDEVTNSENEKDNKSNVLQNVTEKNTQNDKENNEVINKATGIIDGVTNSMKEQDNEINELQNAILEGIFNQSKQMQQ